MTSLKDLPEICRKCAKAHTSSIHGGCEFCLNMRFSEEILCDLNRSAQSQEEFECFQFQPALRSVGLSIIYSETLPEEHKDNALTDNFQALLNSDSFKYQQALAIQRMQKNPDTVFMDLQYHLAWNVAARNPLFMHCADDMNIIQEVFSTCGGLVGGVVSVLWLAPDHIHLYVESDGENPIDAVAHKLKRVSATAIKRNRTKQRPQHKTNRIIWDNAYFAETIG